MPPFLLLKDFPHLGEFNLTSLQYPQFNITVSIPTYLFKEGDRVLFLKVICNPGASSYSKNRLSYFFLLFLLVGVTTLGMSYHLLKFT